MLSVAKSLKHFKVVDTVCDTTTHVVVGENRRTLNVLSAIARGCWLLSMEWVSVEGEAAGNKREAGEERGKSSTRTHM